MAQIKKRGARHLARVRLNQHDVTKSFRTKIEAQRWAARVETEILDGSLGRVPRKLFAEILERYRVSVSVTKDGYRWEDVRIKKLMRDPIAKVQNQELGPGHLSDWRDRRLAEVSGSTVNRELNLISAICSEAVAWGWLARNPASKLRRPKSNPPRTRRISETEIERLLLCFGVGPGPGFSGTARARAGLAFLFALETACRAGEICALEWADIDSDRRVATIASRTLGARKSFFSREVPLSSAALGILGRLGPPGSGKAFGLTAQVLSTTFRTVRIEAMIEGLTFHDSRAEALTRMSKTFDCMQLARISGHRSLKVLHETYYRETASEMASRLD